jgi:hypothetical protein
VGEDTGRSALFDETVSSYARLRDRSEKIIIDTLNSNVREALRPCRHMYVTQSGNASVEPASHTYFLLSSQKSLGDAQRLGRQSRAHGKSTHFSHTCAPRWVPGARSCVGAAAARHQSSAGGCLVLSEQRV